MGRTLSKRPGTQGSLQCQLVLLDIITKTDRSLLQKRKELKLGEGPLLPSSVS